MKLDARRLPSVTLALVAVLVVAAGAGATTQLRMAMWIDDPNEVAEVKRLLAQYERDNPGVKIELVYQGWGGYHENMAMLFAAGLAPDVLTVSRVYLASFVEQGLLQSITDYLTEIGVDVERDIAEVKSGTYKGEIYGIPIWGGPAIYSYNATLVDMAGLERPSNLYEKGLWTWDTIIDMAKKITTDRDGDGIIDIWGLPGPSLYSFDWGAKIYQHGGQVISPDGTRAMINHPEAIEGLRLWADIAHVHHVARIPGEPEGNFIEGTLAFTNQWVSSAPNIARQVGGRFEMDLATQPAGPAGFFHIAGGVPVAVSATTPHPEEAMKLAVWYALYSDQWQLRGIPASLEQIRGGYMEFLSQFFDNAAALIHAMSHPTAPEPGIGVHYAELEAAWNPILLELAYGNIPAETAAEMIAERINEILSR